MPAPSRRLSASASSGARNSARFCDALRAGFSAANLENLSTKSPSPPRFSANSALVFFFQPLQNRQRRFFGFGRQISGGSHARRTAGFTRASLNQLPRFLDQQRMHTE